MLNGRLHIMTDVDEFDRLQKELAHISNRSARVHLLERIMRLYKGAMCPNTAIRHIPVRVIRPAEGTTRDDFS